MGSSRSSPVKPRRRSVGSPSRYVAPCEHSSVTRFDRYAKQVNLEQRQEDGCKNVPLRLHKRGWSKEYFASLLGPSIVAKVLCIHSFFNLPHHLERCVKNPRHDSRPPMIGREIIRAD